MARPKRTKLYGFSERLEEAFLASGMSKKEFAEKIGKERKAVYLYLDGTTPPDTFTLAKICVVLKVSADWLLFGKKNDS